MSKRKLDAYTNREPNILQLLTKYASHKTAGPLTILLWHNLELCVGSLPLELKRILQKKKYKKTMWIIDADIQVKGDEALSTQRLKYAVSGARKYAAEGDLVKFCICLVEITLFVPDEISKEIRWAPNILREIIKPAVDVLRRDTDITNLCLNPYNIQKFLNGDPTSNDVALTVWDHFLAWNPSRPAQRTVMPFIPNCVYCKQDSREMNLKKELGLEKYDRDICLNHSRVKRFFNDVNGKIRQYLLDEQSKLDTSKKPRRSSRVVEKTSGERDPEAGVQKKPEDEIMDTINADDANMQLLSEAHESLSTHPTANRDKASQPDAGNEQGTKLKNPQGGLGDDNLALPLNTPPISDTTTGKTGQTESQDRHSGLDARDHDQELLHHEVEGSLAINKVNDEIISKFGQTFATHHHLESTIGFEMVRLKSYLTSEITKQIQEQVDSDKQRLAQSSEILESLRADVTRISKDLVECTKSNIRFDALEDRLETIEKMPNVHSDEIAALRGVITNEIATRTIDISDLKNRVETANNDLKRLENSTLKKDEELQKLQNQMESTVMADKKPTQSSIEMIETEMNAMKSSEIQQQSKIREHETKLAGISATMEKNTSESRKELAEIKRNYLDMEINMQFLKNEAENLNKKTTTLSQAREKEETTRDLQEHSLAEATSGVKLQQMTLNEHRSEITSLKKAFESIKQASERAEDRLDKAEASNQVLAETQKPVTQTQWAELNARVDTVFATNKTTNEKLENTSKTIGKDLKELRVKIEKAANDVAKESISAKSLKREADDFKLDTGDKLKKLHIFREEMEKQTLTCREDSETFQNSLKELHDKIGSLRDELKMKITSDDVRNLLQEEDNSILGEIRTEINQISKEVADLKARTTVQCSHIGCLQNQNKTTTEQSQKTRVEEKAVSRLVEQQGVSNGTKESQGNLTPSAQLSGKAVTDTEQTRNTTSMSATHHSMRLIRNHIEQDNSDRSGHEAFTMKAVEEVGSLTLDLILEEIPNRLDPILQELRSKLDNFQAETKSEIQGIMTSNSESQKVTDDAMEQIKADLGKLKLESKDTTRSMAKLDKMRGTLASATNNLKATFEGFENDTRNQLKQQKESIEECKMSERGITERIDGMENLRTKLGIYEEKVDSLQGQLNVEKTSAEFAKRLSEENEKKLTEVEESLNDISEKLRNLQTATNTYGHRMNRLQNQIEPALGSVSENNLVEEAPFQEVEQRAESTKRGENQKPLILKPQNPKQTAQTSPNTDQARLKTLLPETQAAPKTPQDEPNTTLKNVRQDTKKLECNSEGRNKRTSTLSQDLDSPEHAIEALSGEPRTQMADSERKTETPTPTAEKLRVRCKNSERDTTRTFEDTPPDPISSVGSLYIIKKRKRDLEQPGQAANTADDQVESLKATVDESARKDQAGRLTIGNGVEAQLAAIIEKLKSLEQHTECLKFRTKACDKASETADFEESACGCRTSQSGIYDQNEGGATTTHGKAMSESYGLLWAFRKLEKREDEILGVIDHYEKQRSKHLKQCQAYFDHTKARTERLKDQVKQLKKDLEYAVRELQHRDEYIASISKAEDIRHKNNDVVGNGDKQAKMDSALASNRKQTDPKPHSDEICSEVDSRKTEPHLEDNTGATVATGGRPKARKHMRRTSQEGSPQTTTRELKRENASVGTSHSASSQRLINTDPLKNIPSCDDNVDYLQPGFDPNSIRVKDLRRIFVAHEIKFSYSSKKEVLVDLFKKEVEPRACATLKKRKRTKASARGITDVRP